jgi:hypothetical protein
MIRWPPALLSQHGEVLARCHLDKRASQPLDNFPGYLWSVLPSLLFPPGLYQRLRCLTHKGGFPNRGGADSSWRGGSRSSASRGGSAATNAAMAVIRAANVLGSIWAILGEKLLRTRLDYRGWNNNSLKEAAQCKSQ